MADLSFYTSRYGLHTSEAAFEKFVASLQNYYDASFYVDWRKVFAASRRYKAELLLLSSLCGEADKLGAARDLLTRFPNVVVAFPLLIGCRGAVNLVEDAEAARVTCYDFLPPQTAFSAIEIEHYARFLLDSGVVELLERINSVPDYVTGVEVGMDTNARKNRGGKCGVRAVQPFVASACATLAGVDAKPEASYDFLSSRGCDLPEEFRGVVWDWAFWTENSRARRFVVMEVNHYGSAGSKPPEVARDYMARQRLLEGTNVGFVWVTDGLGWHKMKRPLRAAFDNVPFLLNVAMARDGALVVALRVLLDLPTTLKTAPELLKLPR